MIEGLSHITFIVQDLDRMEEILTKVLDAKRLYDSGDETFSYSPERFFDIGGVWIATMEGPPLPAKSYNHTAFKIPEEEFEDRLERIKALRLDVKESRSRVAGEGRSIYFHDHDNHLFELHTGTLEQRLRRYGA
jgi:fosfomycin resistance protein FosX